MKVGCCLMGARRDVELSLPRLKRWAVGRWDDMEVITDAKGKHLICPTKDFTSFELAERPYTLRSHLLQLYPNSLLGVAIMRTEQEGILMDWEYIIVLEKENADLKRTLARAE